jgi:hypothetical protein
VSIDPNLEPAPDDFRNLFSGQALNHLDEVVLSWRTGGHPIEWTCSVAMFQVYLPDGPAPLFSLHAPDEGLPAGIEVDVSGASNLGFPVDLAQRLWDELAQIGSVVENPHIPLRVSLGKFSRGDRKVFLAYALTIARHLARPPQDK